jgi:hypothetical protein
MFAHKLQLGLHVGPVRNYLAAAQLLRCQVGVVIIHVHSVSHMELGHLRLQPLLRSEQVFFVQASETALNFAHFLLAAAFLRFRVPRLDHTLGAILLPHKVRKFVSVFSLHIIACEIQL